MNKGLKLEASSTVRPKFLVTVVVTCCNTWSREVAVWMRMLIPMAACHSKLQGFSCWPLRHRIVITPNGRINPNEFNRTGPNMSKYQDSDIPFDIFWPLLGSTPDIWYPPFSACETSNSTAMLGILDLDNGKGSKGAKRGQNTTQKWDQWIYCEQLIQPMGQFFSKIYRWPYCQGESPPKWSFLSRERCASPNGAGIVQTWRDLLAILCDRKIIFVILLVEVSVNVIYSAEFGGASWIEALISILTILKKTYPYP